VVLGRTTVDLELPKPSCSLDDVLAGLADAEPRIVRYLRGEDGLPSTFLRSLLNERLLEPGTPILDGATVTLMYAVAGGCGHPRQRTP
jgi:hypothetical protein